jgi:hypothetical protein
MTFTSADIRRIKKNLRNPEVREAAEFVLKGSLTRLGILFQVSRRHWKGEEVAGFLLHVWQAYCKTKDFDQADPEQSALVDGKL